MIDDNLKMPPGIAPQFHNMHCTKIKENTIYHGDCLWQFQEEPVLFPVAWDKIGSNKDKAMHFSK